MRKQEPHWYLLVNKSQPLFRACIFCCSKSNGSYISKFERSVLRVLVVRAPGKEHFTGRLVGAISV